MLPIFRATLDDAHVSFEISLRFQARQFSEPGLDFGIEKGVTYLLTYLLKYLFPGLEHENQVKQMMCWAQNSNNPLTPSPAC